MDGFIGYLHDFISKQFPLNQPLSRFSLYVVLTVKKSETKSSNTQIELGIFHAVST